MVEAAGDLAILEREGGGVGGGEEGNSGYGDSC